MGDDYVLMKRGLYYRPKSQGYTGILAEAGRYTEEEARARVEGAGGDVTMLPAHDAYPFSPACWPETKIAALEAEIERLRKGREGWACVPLPGTLVSSTHPQTVLNPDKVFEVLEVKSDGDRFFVRGERTCWFGLGMIRPAASAHSSDA
jgi:hypothetical protein